QCGEATGCLRQHLRDDGHDRRLQAAGARQHAENHRCANRRGHQGAVLPPAGAQRAGDASRGHRQPRRAGAVEPRISELTLTRRTSSPSVSLPRLRGRVGAGVALLAALLTGCVGPSASTPEPANTLNVLAGSELKDLAPLMPDIEKAIGAHLAITYTGTLDGAERIVNGANADLAWYASSKYLNLLQ